jgi:hypothetical protein
MIIKLEQLKSITSVNLYVRYHKSSRDIFKENISEKRDPQNILIKEIQKDLNRFIKIIKYVEKNNSKYQIDTEILNVLILKIEKIILIYSRLSFFKKQELIDDLKSKIKNIIKESILNIRIIQIGMKKYEEEQIKLTFIENQKKDDIYSEKLTFMLNLTKHILSKI